MRRLAILFAVLALGAPAHAQDDAPVSCRAERGEAAAARLAETCRAVSPATRPPCNAENSCALVETEIARACAFLGEAAATTAGCETAPASDAAGADVVRRYYAALNARDYATAWTQWGADGRPGETFEAFRRGFQRTREVRVEVGDTAPAEGGAGSLYLTVPVEVEAVLDDATRQRFRGEFVVRRVNQTAGAVAGEQRWHLDSARLEAR